jgi:predicted nuclease of predicted toxin-antitoxin system
MPQTIRFHLDEHVDPAVAGGLRSRGIDVTTTRDAGLLSAPDEEQLAFIRSEGRVIFTEDADFLRLHAAGESHPGIAYCHQQTRAIGEIIRGLVLIWEVLEPDDMRNHVEYL